MQCASLPDLPQDEVVSPAAQLDGAIEIAEAPKEPAADAGFVPQRSAMRLLSLDAFRGLTILGMLLVNNIALDIMTPLHLKHAPWNEGVHFADLVFPWFILIIGVAIPYAVAAHQRRGLPMWRYDLRILSRSVTLVLLGCLIDSSLAKRPVFDLGVLQLIGLAYLVGALLYEMPLRRRLIIAAVFLIAHWAVIRFLPIPGLGAGIFSEKYNVIRHFNQVYLYPLHLSGLMSVIPTSALALIGTVLGDVIRREDLVAMRKVGYLLGGGVVMLVAGWLWNLDLPFNKPVWTASYIVYAAGWGSIILGLFYLLIDVNRWRWWAFLLVVPGMNAITAYVAPILVKIYILQAWTWKMPDGSILPLQQAFMNYCFTHAGRIAGGWIYTFGYIVFWWLILLWMYRKRVFLRV
jgi:predicted acyltransferase